ncbi:hypothetical protein ACSMXN_01570 [Jatrophihabitans sp. DSM 45814]
MSALDSRPDLPDLPEFPVPRNGAAAASYHVSLEMLADVARVTIIGALDEVSADAVGGMISCVPDGPSRVEVIAGGVTSVEPNCVQLLIAAARERIQHGQAPVHVVACSEVLAREFVEAGLLGRLPIALAG